MSDRFIELKPLVAKPAEAAGRQSVYRSMFDFSERAAVHICSGLVLVLAIGLATQVAARFVLHVSVVWTEEIVQFCFMWVAFLGASVGVRRGAHFGISIVVNLLPRQLQRPMTILSCLLMLVLSATLFVQGLNYAQMGLTRFSPNTTTPMIFVYSAIPAGGAMMSLYIMERLYDAFNGREEGGK